MNESVIHVGLRQMGREGLQRLKEWIEGGNPLLLNGDISEDRDGMVLM